MNISRGGGATGSSLRAAGAGIMQASAQKGVGFGGEQHGGATYITEVPIDSNAAVALNQ